jgi:hypothetical protein
MNWFGIFLHIFSRTFDLKFCQMSTDGITPPPDGGDARWPSDIDADLENRLKQMKDERRELDALDARLKQMDDNPGNALPTELDNEMAQLNQQGGEVTTAHRDGRDAWQNTFAGKFAQLAKVVPKWLVARGCTDPTQEMTEHIIAAIWAQVMDGREVPEATRLLPLLEDLAARLQSQREELAR